MVLRNFIYLDEPLVDDFLSAIEGGASDVETVTSTEESKGLVGGRAGFRNLGFQGEKGRRTETGTTAERTITGPAKFQRLYSYLEADGEIVQNDTMDQAKWDAIEKNQVIEATVLSRVSPLEQGIAAAREFAGMAATLENAGNAELIGENGRQAFRQIEAVGKILGVRGLGTVFVCPGSNSFPFVGYAKRNMLRSDPLGAGAEQTLFAKVSSCHPLPMA